MKIAIIIAILVLCLSGSVFCRAGSSVCPKGPRPAEVLYTADVRELPFEEQLFFSSLQGITAQKQPRIYLIRDNESQELFWADCYKKKGYISRLTEEKDPYALFRRFRGEINGAVVWDPALTSTINAATAVAGVKGYAICTPELAERLGLEIKCDLRGMFTLDTQVYGWVYENFGTQLSRQALCSLEPTVGGAWLRDYLIQHRIFTFWVRGKDSTIRGKGMNDEAFMQGLMAHFPANIPVLGFWQAGTIDTGLMEYGGLIFAGKTGKYTVVSDWTVNLSVHSGIRAKSSFRQTKPRSLVYDPNKKYVMVNQYESGDCPWYWERLQYKDWQQPERGTFPMSWCLGPLTLDLLPGVLEWYYDNASANDCFFAAMSGVGYTMVQYFAPGDKEIRRDFLEDTREYMKRLDLSLVSLHTDHWYSEPLAAEKYREYAEIPGLKGILADFGRNEALPEERITEYFNHIPIVHTQNRWSMEGDQSELLRQAILEAKGSFISVMALSWTCHPHEIAEALKGLPREYVPVRADEFFDLLRQKARK